MKMFCYKHSASMWLSIIRELSLILLSSMHNYKNESLRSCSHTHVVRACQLFNIVTVSRELRQTCYFMASNSLHLTTMCLKYRPTVVAAFCIYIACKWSRWEVCVPHQNAGCADCAFATSFDSQIPESREGKSWYSYVDENVTPETLKQLTDEYLQILERSPSKFKSKMKAITSNGQTAVSISQSCAGCSR